MSDKPPGPMRFILACGGTGGHFYPGYALGKVLRQRGHEVLYLVRTGDPAADRLAREDLPFAELDLRGLLRRPSLEWLAFAWRLAGSQRAAVHILRAYRPGAVVGMGGYLTFPAAAAAWLGAVPYVLHESNAVLGLANAVCRPGASVLALGLPLKEPCGGRSVLTGTPVREDLREPAGSEEAPEARRGLGLEPGRRTLLVFGGSQGARGLNRVIPAAVALLERRSPGSVQVLHLSGPKEEAEVRSAYAAAGVRHDVRAYMDDMRRAYAAADLVVSRSGASTVAELVAQRKPSALVPYPYATGRHQEANARVLERRGAARVLLEESLTPGSGAAVLSELLLGEGTDGRLAAMREAFARLDLPAASKTVQTLADIVEEVAGGGRPQARKGIV